MLKNVYNFKIKGDGPLSFHLGCNFARDPDGTMYSEPRQYIEKMFDSYKRMFSEHPQASFRSPSSPTITQRWTILQFLTSKAERNTSP